MKRISELDGVRGVAILPVIIWHYFGCQVVPQPGSVVWYCWRATSLTWSGVDLFFVLSGFLIAGILLDHRDTSNFFRVFYLRRVCRIVPVYLTVLGLYLGFGAMGLAKSSAFLWLFCNPLPIWSYATFTQNLVMSAAGHFGPNWLGVTWSLAIEEQFYVFIPLLVYCLPRRVLLCAFVAAVVAAPILRWVWPGLHAIVGTPWRADSLLSGATLAVLVRWPPFLAAVREHQRVLSGGLVAFLAGAAVLALRADLLGQALYVVFSHLWLAGLYSLLVLVAFAGTEPWLGHLLRAQVLVWFGQLSYGIYLFHQPVSGLLHGLFRQRAPQIRDLSDAGVTLLALGMTLLLAALSYRFLEGPILRLGHRFQYAPRPSRKIALR